MIRSRSYCLLPALLIALAGCQTNKPAPLFDNVARHTLKVTTTSPLAQQYFDQGLTLAYGFNHPEAARSFRAAQQIDSNCAMAYWGEALVLGPNINAPMKDEAAAPAWAALQQALAKKNSASAKEQALIEALATRYAAQPVKDRSSLDKAYCNAMRKVAKAYPADLDVQTLFAEAIMDTMPWDYWQADLTPKELTKELIATLEGVLAKSPDHAGAIHLYIHAVEAGPNPQVAEPYADRLAANPPDSGHLVHMPSHIYVRVGRYHDAVIANFKAAYSDERYITQCNAQGFYPAVYYSHNLHFIWFAAGMEGASRRSIDAAAKMLKYVDDSGAGCHAMEPTLWAPAHTLALARFGKWSDIHKLAAPAASDPWPRAHWHYARGLALVRTGNPVLASEELKQLDAIIASDAGKALELPVFPGGRVMQILRTVLAAEIDWAVGKKGEAIAKFEQAVKVQDGLPYMEPPFFYYPVRQSLGWALLESGDAAKAEAVYREDLKQNPKNGWSLFGLMKALAAQGKADEAKKVEAQFNEAWRHADVKLTASRF